MRIVKKILGVSWLFSGFLLVMGGVASVPAQDQSGQPAQIQPSTQDLEAQPNTNQYPAPPRRHRGIQPQNAQTANPQPSAEPTPTPDPPPSDPPPIARPTPAVTAPVNSVGSRPVPPPQNFAPQHTAIGPPAPLPPTPEQMAPTPPKVSYENGLLSVESTNSRLIDIFNAIRAKAGIQFEGLSAGQERDRVAGKFGPAPADQVLTDLLQGSHFDYVIIGMPENPSLVQRVILTPNPGSGAVAAAPGAQPAQRGESDEDDDSDDDSATESASQGAQQQQPAQGAQFPGRGPKSAEQLLNELKQMQQQAQQKAQQQQQNQPQDTPNQPPTPH